MKRILLGVVIGIASVDVDRRTRQSNSPGCRERRSQALLCRIRNEAGRSSPSQIRARREISHALASRQLRHLSWRPELQVHIPDGTTEDDMAWAGEVRCGDADVHLPENAGRDTAEIVVLEFKDRQTFNK